MTKLGENDEPRFEVEVILNWRKVKDSKKEHLVLWQEYSLREAI